MGKRGQASLEYLLTYGWALILIAIIIGLLVFVVVRPSSGPIFTSSDPSKIAVRAATVNDSVATIVLQNTTGGDLDIVSVSLDGALSGCKLNGVDFNSGNGVLHAFTTPMPIVPGGILEFSQINHNGTEFGFIDIFYTDYVGFVRTVRITVSISQN